MIHRYEQHVSGLAAALLVFGLYAMLVQGQPIEYYERNYSTSEISPGVSITVDGMSMRTAACSRKTIRQWIDQEGNILGEPVVDYAGVMPAGRRYYSISVKVPDIIPPGVVRYRVKSEFYCNFLQRMLGIGSDFVMPDVIFNTKAVRP